MENNKKNNLLGSGILLIAAIIWGLAFVAQNAVADLSPFFINCTRSLIATVFLYILYKILNAKNKTHIFLKNKDANKTIIKGGLLCGVMLFIAINFQQFGIYFYPSGAPTEAHSGFITALYVLLVPIFSSFMGKKIKKSLWIWITIALIGFYFLCFGEGFDSVYIADFIVLICAVAFTIHIIVVDKYAGFIGGVKLSMIQFFVCGILSGLLYIVFDWGSVSAADMLTGLPAILYLGIMSSGVAYTLQIVGQKYASPEIASLTMCLESVFAAVGGYLAGILGITASAPLSINEIIGCALVFSATLLAQFI